MKKLLVLMLVLGMVSTASAVTLSLTQPDPWTPVVVVSGDLDQDLYIAMLSEDGSFTQYYLHIPPAPTMSGYFGTEADMIDKGFGFLVPTGYTGKVWIMEAQPGEAYIAGDYLTAFSNNIGIWAYAAWFDDAGNSGIIGHVFLVPEPMTLALLGLGSLFVLRHRK